MTMILTFTGCGSSKPVVEVTPTPAATPTPTEVPVTVTPVPTSTPAPKVIGVKTSQAKYIYMTNKLEDDIREIYLMTSGGDDWGKNLIPAEASVKASEQVQMFYTPDDTAVSSDSTDESTDTTTTTVYDMKIVTAKGDVYQIYSIDLSDMEKASLAYDEESSTAYLTYTSLKKIQRATHSRQHPLMNPMTVIQKLTVVMTAAMTVVMTVALRTVVAMMTAVTTAVMTVVMTVVLRITVVMMMAAAMMTVTTMMTEAMIMLMREMIQIPMTVAVMTGTTKIF